MRGAVSLVGWGSPAHAASRSSSGGRSPRSGGASFGRRRPGVAGIVGVDPLELAGGHGFVTDLIGIAGGTSVTHAGEAVRVPAGVEDLSAGSPERVRVVTPAPLDERARAEPRHQLPAEVPVVFVAFDAEAEWMLETVWRWHARCARSCAISRGPSP